MIGGFLKGALTGTIVAGLAAGTVSVLSDPPARDAPQAGTVEVTPGSGFDARREDGAATLPDAEPRPEAGDPPQVSTPAPRETPPSGDADTAPAGDPLTEAADTLGEGPVPGAGSSDVAARRGRPVASDPPTAMPEAAEADQAARMATPEADQPALRRNAAAFANRGDKPLMAIVLMAGDGDAVSIETLMTFPYPLSIAVDPDRADAAEIAARYRAAGFEVLLTVDLPQDAAPSDIRATLRSSVAEVPQAVAVLEGRAGGLPVAGAAPILAQTGHGLVIQTLEADAARGVLTTAEVPAAPLQRDLDGQGQDADAVQAGLDQAAAVADAQRGVIVLGRMRADTLRALSLWSGQGGARRVALAPVSAVLLAQDSAESRE
ncbi:MAG: divergent polysaccharide deacetylase family protein [Roseovarius sp.]